MSLHTQAHCAMQSAVRVAEKVRLPLWLLDANLIPTNSEAAEGWLRSSV